MWKQTETLGLRREAICLTLDVLGLIKQDKTPEWLFIRHRNITKGFFLLTQMRSDGTTDETLWSL